MFVNLTRDTEGKFMLLAAMMIAGGVVAAPERRAIESIIGLYAR
jgi:hypothetical protein